MEFSEARQQMVEHMLRQPQPYEVQLETVFTNPHFGDVVTEVFPEVLDPHNREGRSYLAKYAQLAEFLSQSQESDDACFVAVRVETEQLASHGPEARKNTTKALSVRLFNDIKPEHFEVERDGAGEPIGIRVDHPSLTYTNGWTSDSLHHTVPTTLLEPTADVIRWRAKPQHEQESPVYFMDGETRNALLHKVAGFEKDAGLYTTPITGVLLNMQIESIRRRAGHEPRDYPPLLND